jgi:arylformamidase
MEIKDVTLMIEPDMPVWPGDEQVQLSRRQKLEDGANANVSVLGLSVHTGTHVDAPFHFLQNGYTVDQIPLDLLVGETQLVQIPDDATQIDAATLSHAGIRPGITRVLFKTSNSRYWARGEKEFQKDFVGVTSDGAQWLVDFGIRVVGIDYLSIAPYKKSKLTHETLLNAKTLIIEGLYLVDVEPGIWTMYCLPIKLKGSDGAPARVILIR